MPLRREVARTILDVFKQQRSQPGYGLPSDVIAALSEQKGWTARQLLTGIEYGCAARWFEIGPNPSIKLTSTGFLEISSEGDDAAAANGGAWVRGPPGARSPH
jgi:hypothetical protein